MVTKATKISTRIYATTLKAMYPTAVVATVFLEGMRLIARRSGRYKCDISIPHLDMLGGFGGFLQRGETRM